MSPYNSRFARSRPYELFPDARHPRRITERTDRLMSRFPPARGSFRVSSISAKRQRDPSSPSAGPGWDETSEVTTAPAVSWPPGECGKSHGWSRSVLQREDAPRTSARPPYDTVEPTCPARADGCSLMVSALALDDAAKHVVVNTKVAFSRV